MNKVSGVLMLGALAMVLSGCKPPDTHDADVKAIQDTEDQWNKDFAAKDGDKLAAHYDDDAVMMLGDSPALVGKRNVLKAVHTMIADPAMVVTFHASKVDVAKSGDLGYTQGSYITTMSDPITKKPMTSHGSYLTIYRKEDGAWLAVEDLVSADAPPAGPPAAVPAPKGKAFHVTPFD